MATISFTVDQQKIIKTPIKDSLFIEGPACAGKTTATIERLKNTLKEYPGYNVLILIPQQSLGKPYRQFLIEKKIHNGSVPTITTISGLLRELTQIFWPLVSVNCGFVSPHKKPQFLSLETAQYCMARIVDPLLEKGYFQSVTIEPNRLFSQIIDNLNKSAIHGLDLSEIANRLTSTSNESEALGKAYLQVQECAFLFRKFCLEKNLLDYSLLLHIANNYLLKNELCQQYISTKFKVLFADNIEEDTPFTHKFINRWSSTFESTTLIFDQNGGFRSFLGADAESAYTLRQNCDKYICIPESFRKNDDTQKFREQIISCISNEKRTRINYQLHQNINIQFHNFLPEVIDHVANTIKSLIDKGVKPGNIAVLSPYLTDALKFSLISRLNAFNIPTFSSRPSRMYISSPAIKTLISLAKLAHPEWGFPVSHYEYRDCMMSIIPNLDIIRAEHAAKLLLPHHPRSQSLRSFDEITNISLQETITFSHGKKLESLRQWLTNYTKKDPYPLDLFIKKIFGEILSQPEFAFHHDFEAANDIEKLVRSIYSFRLMAKEVFSLDGIESGKEYLHSLLKGLIPSAFHSENNSEGCVLITPAYTFLMQNRTVDYQYWMDLGSLGWWERLYQPLTNPYVFRKNWKIGELWDQEHDFYNNQQVMKNLINGLLLRCKKGIYASALQTNEYGTQNNGPLLQAFQTYLKRCKHHTRANSNV